MGLKTLPIPIPDEELTHSIAQLTETVQRFDELSADARFALDEIFQFENAEDARRHILSTGRSARVFCDAASRSKDFGHVVRTHYPHPLALLWRRVESGREDLSGYIETLQCGESLVCYLASLVIVAARDSGKQVGALKNLDEKLMARGGGASLGDWVNILRQAHDCKDFRDSDASSLLYELAGFANREVDQVIQTLSSRRNAHAHGRGPEARELTEACSAARELVRRLYEGAGFLTDYPLIFVEETARDSLDGITSYKFRRLVGDHPLVPIESAKHPSAEIDKG